MHNNKSTITEVISRFHIDFDKKLTLVVKLCDLNTTAEKKFGEANLCSISNLLTADVNLTTKLLCKTNNHVSVKCIEDHKLWHNVIKLKQKPLRWMQTC